MKRMLLGMLLLGSVSWGQTVSWSKVQGGREYKIAREHVADALPDLAIPIIQDLLKNKELDPTARASLLTFLGETQLRAQKLEEALFTLADSALVEFSPAHKWRGFTLSQLGHYQEAIESFQKIDRKSMIPNARLQESVLLIAIGDQEAAIPILEALLKTEDIKIREEANLRLISILMSSGRLDEAEENLKTFKLTELTFESHLQFLRGKLLLEKGSRIPAVGIFQALLKKIEEPNHGLPAPLVHELNLALADSLALDGNEEEGAASILTTLGKYPNSPRIREAFQRLNQWTSEANSKAISEKLKEWLSQNASSLVDLPLLGALESGSVSAPNQLATTTFLTARSAYSLLHLATENLKTIENRALGLAQLESLLITAPGSHPEIKTEALTTYGLATMSERQFEQALHFFFRLREESPSLSGQATANALMGEAAYALLDKRKASQAFLDSQARADEAKNIELSRLSALNAGISLLSIADPGELDQITAKLKTPGSRADLVLERGLRLSDLNDPSARDLLDQFLSEFPQHPRRDEAALSLSESYLFAQPRRESFAREHLKPLKFDLEKHSDLEVRRILAYLEMNEGVTLVTEFLKKLPGHPFAPRILFQQGRVYQRMENPKPGIAYQTFETFLSTYPEDPLIEVVRLQSAISGLAAGTESSKSNALVRLDELIAAKGVLATEAAILRTRLFIDQGEQTRAHEAASEILKKKPLATNYRWRALVLKGEAHYQLNEDEKALAAYNKLLSIQQISIATRNRASFLKARCLKNLDRHKEALETLYSVVNRQIDPERMNDLEWKWFDECGKGALKLLEEEENWTAAIKLAEKISLSGSPSASDAAERANRLRLDNFIWE